MAWVATDNFNSYSDGSINGANSGSGWAGAWSLASGTIDIQGTTTYEGAKAVTADTASADLASRQLTSTVTVGTVYVAMRASTTTIIGFFILENGAGTGKMYIKFDSDGNIKAFDNGTGTYQTIQAYSANTWYVLAIDFDNTGQPNKYRVKVNNGSYSSYYTVNGGTYSSISHVRLETDSATGSIFWDRISDTSPGTDYPLTASVGSFTLTGQNANLKRGIKIIGAVGVFTLTGISATLKLGKGIVANVGSFIITGVNALLSKGGWENQSKNSSTFTNISKNTSTFTNVSKNSTSWTKQTK